MLNHINGLEVSTGKHCKIIKFNFNQINRLEGRIEAPLVPLVRFDGDARNFDAYPEISNDALRGPAADPFRHLFPGFFLTFNFLYLDF